MSDLTRFRDYCRNMAGSPVAPGCPAATDRALWLQLASEVDNYLANDLDVIQTPEPDDEHAPLW